jgi:hypothetical protein
MKIFASKLVAAVLVLCTVYTSAFAELRTVRVLPTIAPTASPVVHALGPTLAERVASFHAARAVRIAHFQDDCTVTVAADPTEVNDAIFDGARSAGDVVCVEPGTIDYRLGNFAMRTDFHLELRGAGAFVSPWGSAGQTIWRVNDDACSSGCNGALAIREVTTGNQILSNMTFQYDETFTGVPRYGLLLVEGIVGGEKVILHHNNFETSGRCDAPRIILWAAKGGLMYRNKWINVPQYAAGPNSGGNPCDYVTTNVSAIVHEISDSGSYWNSTNTFGDVDDGTNNLYVETNYFEGLAVGIDDNTSARTVWRYNTQNGSAIADHGFDSSSQGVRHKELYGNNYTCEIKVKNSSMISQRGGTSRIFNNTFADATADTCGYPNGNIPAIKLSQFKAFQCEEIPGWPGTYPDTYPLPHQVGWGWKSSNTHTGVGAVEGDPSGGFDQSLEPIYIFNNGGPNADNFDVSESSGYQCDLMTSSEHFKATASTDALDGPIYVSSGQFMIVAFSDLIGGTAPTISDDCNGGQTWTALTGGTNGSLRLSAWWAKANASCVITVSISHDSSAAARAIVFGEVRGTVMSPVDKNPAVVTDNTSPYTGPATGTLSQGDSTHAEMVIGYFALNGPTTFSTNVWVNDAIDGGSSAPSGYRRGVYYSRSGYLTGINGTSGGADNTNAIGGLTYKIVESTASEAPDFRDTTADRNGIAGTVSIMLDGGTSAAHLRVQDVLQPDVEYFAQNDSFDGTTGTGTGLWASRPMTCTQGVGYWATDQGGNWKTKNTDGTDDASANDGALYVCDGSNTFNLFYTPYVYPHPLATVVGMESSPSNDSAVGGRIRVRGIRSR